MTLEHLAERAKTSTEAEARARVTWARLQELAVKFNDAKKAFYAIPPTDIDAQIQWDLDAKARSDALEAARAAYTVAIKKYQEQGK